MNPSETERAEQSVDLPKESEYSEILEDIPTSQDILFPHEGVDEKESFKANPENSGGQVE